MAYRLLRSLTTTPTRSTYKRVTGCSVYQSANKSTVIVDKLNDIDVTEAPGVSGNGHPTIDLTFANPEETFKSKTTGELIRAFIVFQLCSVQFIVDNNKTLMKWSQKLLGATIFEKLMKATFYGHFVAGPDQVAIRPLINRNRKFGVKSILDYSAEEDVSSEHAKDTEMGGCAEEEYISDAVSTQPQHQRFRAYREFGDRRDKVISSRTYLYEGEEQCDKNLNIFLDSIDGVSDATDKTGFCAVKLTALGRPQLLLQMSEVLVSARKFFVKMVGEDKNATMEGSVDGGFARNFSKGFREEEFLMKLQNLGVKITPEESRRWFSILDMTKDGQVDLMDWDNLLEVNMNLSKMLVVPDIKTGELVPLLTCLSDETEQEMRNMLHRIDNIARYAVEKDVRVMIDAEQTYFQPAISRLTLECMKKFNKEKAIVFNTYQCYLKAAMDSIKLDLDIARRDNFYFGAKLVRGAYMEQERERAKAVGYEDPINPDFEATTDMYNRVLRESIRQIQMRERGKIAVMIASHNEDTVRYTVQKMKEYDVKPADRVICFGQLLGMCDNISFPLGQAGYSVYKYVPYGPVAEVMPYLSRRAQENKGILVKVRKEKTLLKSELKRRFKRRQFSYDPLKNTP